MCITWTSSAYAISWDGSNYYFIKNLQGDVLHILDNMGNVVVSYVYDAWGKVYSVTGSMADTLGTINPIRYRSYYYDNETGFYYLNSRYYDPDVKRYINADAEIAGAGGELKGYNLFSYCMNNPVNMTDEDGNWPKWLGKAIAVVAVAAVVVAAVAVTVVTFGATSVAGVAVITAAATIAARATEVAVLQVKKSTSDVKTPSGNSQSGGGGFRESTDSGGSNSSGSSSGKKSGGEVVGDVFEALYDNGGTIIGITPVIKSITVGGQHLLNKQVLKIFGEKATLKSTLSSVGGKVIPYAFVVYAWGQTTISIFSDDPVQRAEDRGYKLK